MTKVALHLMDPRAPEAVECLGSYYAELEARFERGFDVSLSRDPEADDMIAPRGAFFVAFVDGVAKGCIGLKRLEPEVGEIKRLWVDPDTRGLGIGARLMEATDAAAIELGMTTLRLDTNSALPEAARLYHRLGWYEIDRYNDDPYPDLFFEKLLMAKASS